MTAVEGLALFLLTQKIWWCWILGCWGTEFLPLDSHWQHQVLFEEGGNWFRTQCFHLCEAWNISMCSFILQVSTALLLDSDLCFASALSNPCWMSWFINSSFLLKAQFSLQYQPMEIVTILWGKNCRKNTTRLICSMYTLNIFLKLQNKKQILYANKEIIIRNWHECFATVPPVPSVKCFVLHLNAKLTRPHIKCIISSQTDTGSFHDCMSAAHISIVRELIIPRWSKILFAFCMKTCQNSYLEK